jgi:hypothetical protein
MLGQFTWRRSVHEIESRVAHEAHARERGGPSQNFCDSVIAL